jgi:long-chain acyl-CoA synthetase
MEKYRKEVTKKGFGDRRYRHRPENLYASPVNTFLSAPLLTILHFIADQLVYKKIRQKMGGRIHHFVAGGAPLSADIINFFKYLNVTIYEGYGMTETSPVISFNYRGSMKPGTTGKLLPNVQVKFSAEGEILVKGPNVMLGYHNNPAATAQLINSEGWLHTGDMGKWDDGNYLKITGRLKDLIVLSTGKNVPLLPIEDKLKRFPLVTNVVVVGNNRKFITALIFANLTEIESLAKMKGISTTNPDELCNHEEIEKEFSEIIEKVNHGFSPYEQIKKFAVVAHNIGEDPELVTPTLKIKRGMVEKKFADIIEKMYQ